MTYHQCQLAHGQLDRLVPRRSWGDPGCSGRKDNPGQTLSEVEGQTLDKLNVTSFKATRGIRSSENMPQPEPQTTMAIRIIIIMIICKKPHPALPPCLSIFPLLRAGSQGFG